MSLRVLHVLEALEGGTSRHLIDVVRHAHGIEHEVVVPERRIGSLTDETALGHLRAAGAAVHLVDMRRAPWAPANAAAVRRIRALARERRPDLVHGHSSIGGLLARLASTGLGVPRVYTPNGITQVRPGQLVERAMRPLTDRLVAVSASEGDLAVRLGLVPRPRLAVIPNGIAVEAPPVVALREQLGVPGDVPLVGMLGRLVPQKAPLDFVAACARIADVRRDVRFVLIGGGALQREVDDAVAARGLAERFTRIETVVGAAGALGQLDVFVLTSRFEGGPYAPLEAMRAGTPCVVTDVVGNRDAIEHGVTGLLVPPGAPAAAAGAVLELLADDDRRAAMGAAGPGRVAKLFDVREMGERLAALYAALVTPAPG